MKPTSSSPGKHIFREMMKGNRKRRIRFIGIHFTGIALEILLVLKQHFSENDPGTTGIRITRNVIHTLSIFLGRPTASGSLGMGLGNLFFKSFLEIFLCLVKHTEGYTRKSRWQVSMPSFCSSSFRLQDFSLKCTSKGCIASTPSE